MTPGASTEPSDLSLVLIQLMKGPLYRDTHEKLWGLLLGAHHQVSDYVTVLGLNAVVDEAEGYAYLRSRPIDDDAAEFPRLVARRALSFHVSVLLALLRKRLAEFDASSADIRLILSRDQMVEMLRLFMPGSTNDARLVDTIDAHINKVTELGFLRRLRDEQDLFEVRRILKAYVDGQWLSQFDARLDDYLTELNHVEGSG
ncbi:MAG: DUF4194 domain-containing protein [Acidimicrobiaceae bacterium]|nr:DUF4194 domain-containing protein [Acidimicrobiaceae bacterium]